MFSVKKKKPSFVNKSLGIVLTNRNIPAVLFYLLLDMRKDPQDVPKLMYHISRCIFDRSWMELERFNTRVNIKR